MSLDYTRKKRTDGYIPLTSVEQHTGLELDRLQARGQVRSQPGILVSELSERGLILLRSGGIGGGIRDRDHMIDNELVRQEDIS